MGIRDGVVSPESSDTGGSTVQVKILRNERPINQDGLKRCYKCKRFLPATLEYFNREKKRGLQPACKECIAAYHKIHHQTEGYKSRRKTGRDRHRERERASHREWYQKNKDSRAAYMKEYRGRPGVAERKQERRKTSRGKINNSMGRLIYKGLKESKSGLHWENFVPYTLDELRRHLERQFTDKMSWENHGKYWHIDHIIPLSLFKFDSHDSPEFQAAWALSNLRPLESKENIQKGANRLFLL